MSNDVTIKLEALHLETLLKALQHLDRNELQKRDGHELTLKFSGISSELLTELVDDIDRFLATQSKIKAKITTKSVREVFAPPPRQPETMSFLSIIRPRIDEERN